MGVKVWRWVFTLFLMLPVFLANAWGAELKVTSSTHYLWYQDILTSDNERDIAEYLRINVTKLDKEGKVNIYAYGRASKQISSSEDYQGRLYYFYLDYRDALNGFLDLRAGRTYVNAAAISGLIDGAYVDLKKVGPVGVTLFGGRDVRFQEKKEISVRGDAITGGSVYLDTLLNTHLEVSYARKYNDTNTARENVGFDFTTTPLSRVNLYGYVKYDLIAEATNELLLGMKFNPFQSLIVRGEYYESYPTFDTDSIYSIFAVNQYKEKSIKAEYVLNERCQLSAGYAREEFNDGATADLYEVGFTVKPIQDLQLDVSYEARNGYAGQLKGIRGRAAYRLLNKATIMAGADYDDFRREDSRNGYAKKYWGGLDWEITKNISTVVRVEDNMTYNYDHSYQGLFALNLKF